VPPEWADKLIHASIEIGDQEISGADEPGTSYQSPQGFSISLNVIETLEAERLFVVLSDGGTVRIPLAETFWAARFGMLTDRFGIPWMINCSRPS
jgi:PhnB protein